MNVTIVGCGAIAASHIRILRKLKPHAVVSLCDTDGARLADFAGRWGVTRTGTDLGALLAAEQPVAVHVTTPPGSHAAVALQALDAGAHVYVEKPVTPTAGEFRTLRDAAAKRNRTLYGGYSTLGMPVVVEARRLITSGALGRPVAVHCTFAGSEGGGMIPYKDPAHWAYRLRGGILQNMLDHPLSLALSLLGPVDGHDLQVVRRNMLPYDCPDLLHLTVRAEDQVGSVTLALGHGANERRAVIVLEGGSVMLDLGRQLVSVTRGRGPQNFVKKALSGVNEGWAFAGGTVSNIWKGVRGKLARDPGIAGIMQNFYDVAERGQDPLVANDMLLSLTGLLDTVWDEIDYRALPGEREVTA